MRNVCVQEKNAFNYFEADSGEAYLDDHKLIHLFSDTFDTHFSAALIRSLSFSCAIKLEKELITNASETKPIATDKLSSYEQRSLGTK